MKFIKKIGTKIMMAGLAAIAMVLSVRTAQAQQGFDPYYGQRIYISSTNQALSTIGTATYNSTFTNDLGNLVGKLVLLIEPTTNAGADVITASIQASQDATNFYTVTNYWEIQQPTNESVPNFYNNGTVALALTNTSQVLLPGVLASYNGAGSGFVGQALVPFLETTNVGCAISVAQDQPIELAFNRLDQQRYWRITYAISGATNANVSAQFMGVTGPNPNL